MKEREPVLKNRAETAWIMGVSVQSFSVWSVTPVDGLYDLKEVIAYQRERDASRGSSGLTDERTKTARIKNEIAELELNALRERYLDAQDVEKVWVDQVTTFKTRLRSFHSRITRRILDKPLREAEAMVKAAIDTILLELSEYEYGAKINGKEPGKPDKKASKKSKRKAKTAGKAKR